MSPYIPPYIPIAPKLIPPPSALCGWSGAKDRRAIARRHTRKTSNAKLKPENLAFHPHKADGDVDTSTFGALAHHLALHPDKRDGGGQ